MELSIDFSIQHRIAKRSLFDRNKRGPLQSDVHKKNGDKGSISLSPAQLQRNLIFHPEIQIVSSLCLRGVCYLSPSGYQQISFSKLSAYGPPAGYQLVQQTHYKANSPPSNKSFM
jgi:hypothetical protein